ncbi:sugar kinase [Cypionkella sp.]|uniref:sugar kinase n=1 Tax=Cypionkella sp. TaxID=2811411 RepID=UPI002AB87711|nr:sugar kinase [Cypionkella sp.]MDZ4395263.1 sugar kinase [Cypionkella sp.]
MHSRFLTGSTISDQSGRQSGRIISIGECMVELAPRADGTYTMGFAGDTLNTAWYLRRALPAAWSVDYMTCIGTDAVSDRMLAFLGDAGIGTTHIARLPDRTVGLYLIELAHAERSFLYWRGQSAARLLARDPARLAQALTGADVAYLSGITLAILEDDRPTLLTSLTELRARGGMVVFDPNLRSRLWPNATIMCDAIMQAATQADIALPSHEDEAAAFGDASPEATARRYQQAGVPLVVVKNGPGSIITLANGTLAHHDVAPVRTVVDTTAAGDSFNAGFLAAHLTGNPLTQSVAAGAAIAARVISSHGALIAQH